MVAAVRFLRWRGASRARRCVQANEVVAGLLLRRQLLLGAAAATYKVAMPASQADAAKGKVTVLADGETLNDLLLRLAGGLVVRLALETVIGEWVGDFG